MAGTNNAKEQEQSIAELPRGEYLERRQILKSRYLWGTWVGILLILFFWWTIIVLPVAFWLTIKGEKAKKQLKESETEREQWELEQWSAVGARKPPV
jgi:hypothetical protein